MIRFPRSVPPFPIIEGFQSWLSVSKKTHDLSHWNFEAIQAVRCLRVLIEWSGSSRVCLYIKVDLTIFMSLSRIFLTRNPRANWDFISLLILKRLKTLIGCLPQNFLFLFRTFDKFSPIYRRVTFRRCLEYFLQISFITLISQRLKGKPLDPLPSHFCDCYFLDFLQTRIFEPALEIMAS